MTWKTIQDDDRAVSIALAHILTIGITAILITGLFVAAGGLLEDEKSDATRSELRTIGNRLASEMTSAYQASSGSTDGEITLRVDHPSLVAGQTYNVEVRDSCSGPALPGGDPCLVLEPVKGQDTVKVALDPDLNSGGYDLIETTVSGGEMYIVIEDTGSGVEIELSNDPTPRLAPPKVTP